LNYPILFAIIGSGKLIQYYHTQIQDMPIQIKRHLIVLVVLVGIFIVFRQMMIPESFGELGHYRANSLIDNEHKEASYAGREMCYDCHDDIFMVKESDFHANLSCESCHGPGLAHIDNQDSVDMLIPESREHCGLCHEKNAARPANAIIQIDMQDHNPDQKCNFCHNPHAPWELRNQDLPEENF